MKNIGILTFHRSINYGAYLQCYSLYKYLKKNFPDCNVEVIDYTRKFTMNTYRKSRMKNIVKDPANIISLYKRKAMFDRYQKYLTLSKKSVISDNTDLFVKKYKNQYDVIIVGSDVVWGINPKVFPNPYWLNADLGCKKMSYAAASHGTDYDHLSSNIKEYCVRALNNFDYIGVRDAATENFISTLARNQNVFHNCDPTVLLDMQDVSANMDTLKQKLYSLNGFDPRKKTIAVMMFDTYVTKLLLDKYSQEYNLIALYIKNPSLMSLYDLDIFEWANVFSLVDLTITTFFHGTLFSLKNGTPVISVNIKEKDEIYLGKTEDILTRMDMKENFFHLKDIKNNPLDFCNHIEKMLLNPPKEKIALALEREARYVKSFSDALHKLLNDETIRR